MQVAERDPRKDPQVGDILIYGPQWQRERAEVTMRFEDEVTYRIGNAEVLCDIDNWQEWMADAEVIRADS